ncbi:TlpA family protein disulfide reductase [Nocardia arthritidis]|uniref:Redoxin domain-containing protein n=1 Tax=Nocardia arthritidis TaxID=228602 RepID=A0A6G9YHU1_9NOCA|nr:redoxin domain-containing protein [Nocardia arthritidis]QIS12761.1 redoxin domain-containing protein [Nocardia arthritidis]
MSAPLMISLLTLWILVGAQALLMMGVTRSLDRLRHPPDPGRAMIGRRAPEFAVTATGGEPVGATDFAGHPGGLLFVSPTCSSCHKILDGLSAALNGHRPRLVLVCRGDGDACARLLEHRPMRVPVVTDPDAVASLTERFRIRGTPRAVLFGPDGRITDHWYPGDAAQLLARMTPASTTTPQTSADIGRWPRIPLGEERR